ncbi:O-antigen polymerase [Mucilaginibacter paludis DSM 18603]|uniref:O-antigen polymerase n=2 Tax=Mucilaginibacter TaxID=423349 RepID=H1YB94_9SPHI|nr:O-antigen polymerase [Mucilaginibacter paludis DSM 18603]
MNPIKNKRQLLPIVFCLSGMCISAFCGSRAFFLGFVISLWLIAIRYFCDHKRRILWMGLVIVFILAIGVIQLKSDSSLGRLLIYKISLSIWRDHFLQGVGWSGFKKVYLEYQAAYFATGHYSNKELLLADNTRFAFNDYWQVILELGVFGCVLVSGHCYFLFVAIKSALSFEAGAGLIFELAFISCLTISIAACFTHVLENLWAVCCLVTAVSILLYRLRFPKFNRGFQLVYASMLSGLLIFSDGTRRLYHYRVYQTYEESRMLVKSGFRAAALNKLQSLYPVLNHDGDYLSYFGKQLAYSNKTKLAVMILKQAGEHLSIADNYMQLGECYYLLHEFSLAEAAYIQGINMVPNRFRNRYALYVFYRDTGQTKKAAETGKGLLNLPVKIPSAIIKHIQSVVAQDFNK